MELDEIAAAATRLSMWAHLATVGADAKPDVVPVVPAWRDGSVWVGVHTHSVKARNLAANPNVALHWQVDEAGDGVEVWGAATMHTDLETKRQLWTGLFDYDLDDFYADGPESADAGFVEIVPERALYLLRYGAAGRHLWTAPSA